MPRNQSTAAKRARHAGGKYTAALREEQTRQPAGPPDNGFGGHSFEYESTTDLFRCEHCREYEVVARKSGVDGKCAPCPGLVGYNGDAERVYLLLTLAPFVAEGYLPAMARRVRDTGIGHAPRFSYRDNRMLIETTPNLLDELERQIDQMEFAQRSGAVHPVERIERLAAAQGQQVLATNYALYVEKYGEPHG